MAGRKSAQRQGFAPIGFAVLSRVQHRKGPTFKGYPA